MGTVPEEIVEATWRRVASLNPADAGHAMEKAAHRQPALLAYVMASTADSRAPVQELAVYLYYVVLQMFEASSPKQMRKVKIGRVEHHSSRNENLLERLESAHDRFFERAARVESSSQPFVLKYVTEALLEESDPSLSLTEEESGLIFLTLKTVIDALDEACAR